MEEELTPSVATEEPTPEPSGEETSEVQEVTEEQPGTEQEPQETEVYTKDQVEQLVQQRLHEMQSTTNQEMDRLRQHNTQLAMQQHIERLRAQEQASYTKDMRDVEAGNITLQDAQQRQQGRYQDVQLQLQRLQLQEELRHLQGSVEKFARVEVARQIAEEFGVKVDDIVKENDEAAMIKKAAKLALNATKKQAKKDSAPREDYSPPETTLRGGKAPITRESLKKMSQDEFKVREAEIDEAYSKGLI